MTGVSDRGPVHVSITVGTEQRTRIVVNGVNITPHVRGFKVHAGVGALADVWLELIGVTVDIQAEVPCTHVQEMTLEEDQTHQDAQQTLDRNRGQKPYGPHALLALSLGQVKP